MASRQKDNTKIELNVNRKALKKLKLVAVAYSHVEREFFPTEGAYIAEIEVEERAQQVIDMLKAMGINAKGYAGNEYFIPNLLVDQPDLVINLVDTLKGKDLLQTSIPAALELANIPYTGAGMQGLVIGNNRNLTKQLLKAFDIPTPDFQFITRAGTKIDESLQPPFIVKLNESGGSVGIDNNAVKETQEAAQEQAETLMKTYKVPVVVERFIDGREITLIVFEDGKKHHVFLAEKDFKFKPDGKHNFTSLESYNDPNAYHFKHVDKELADKISRFAIKAFRGLHHKDYGKFDIRVDEATGTPYVTDSNPNTAFGPGMDQPLTEVLALHGIKFEQVLASLVSKYASKIE